ncbi:phosphoribosylanthranilate isomerase [Methanoplanus endosymbiosus]|uniref:N-(5'-phosphoribosyl)anthranilate isomerase n=1 Tax=Methanoplanus endosymbiosus TaxID=33865 RepID=A0A9E7PPC0_9EURY|nr:phosphoribosylanthranilate isomerase [Methanoplanus endosymbiosus]UUX92576.1 phosphoribosylanthranilate isomerase [Methanoplanus endosymbiosus]
MRIKICGITTVRDAVIAESLGADAIGVVVCSESQRNVTLKRAREIFSALKPTTEKILVTNTKSYPELELMMAQRPDAVQITHPFEFRKRPPVRIIRAVKPGMKELSGDCDAFIIDGSMGKGMVFDRNFASGFINRTEKPVFLAGGLSPENVGEAVRMMNPYGVDVSSGVEKSPGIKDRKKMSEFIRICREA